MKKRNWSRRELLKSGTMVAGGAMTSLLPLRRAFAQIEQPQPLQDPSVSFVTTKASLPWQEMPVFGPSFDWTMLNLNLTQKTSEGPAIQGFGACFNELGWTSLQALNYSDDLDTATVLDAVMEELFDPNVGARFTYCRMPVGANDFSTEAYSYDETDGDFELKNFSIDHDRKTLVPFIQSALKLQPNLKLWASPWTPPNWMKRNHFYAEAKSNLARG